MPKAVDVQENMAHGRLIGNSFMIPKLMPEAVVCKNCGRERRDQILLDENGLCVICHSCRVPELKERIAELERNDRYGEAARLATLERLEQIKDEQKAEIADLKAEIVRLKRRIPKRRKSWRK